MRVFALRVRAGRFALTSLEYPLARSPGVYRASVGRSLPAVPSSALCPLSLRFLSFGGLGKSPLFPGSLLCGSAQRLALVPLWVVLPIPGVSSPQHASLPCSSHARSVRFGSSRSSPLSRYAKGSRVSLCFPLVRGSAVGSEWRVCLESRRLSSLRFIRKGPVCFSLVVAWLLSLSKKPGALLNRVRLASLLANSSSLTASAFGSSVCALILRLLGILRASLGSSSLHIALG